jgi:hypothetical protein
MAPVDKAVSNITLHFCLLKKCRCDKNPAFREGYGMDLSWPNLWGAELGYGLCF